MKIAGKRIKTERMRKKQQLRSSKCLVQSDGERQEMQCENDTLVVVDQMRTSTVRYYTVGKKQTLKQL